MFTRLLAILVVVIFFQHGYLVNGITCYECSSASINCISDSGRSSPCDKKYCTIYRRDYNDPVGKIQQFYRSCDNAPSYLNAVVRTTSHVEYYRACDRDLCNSGDGIDDFVIRLKNTSETTVYIVPGVGSNGTTTLRLDWLIIGLVCLAFFLRERQIVR